MNKNLFALAASALALLTARPVRAQVDALPGDNCSVYAQTVDASTGGPTGHECPLADIGTPCTMAPDAGGPGLCLAAKCYDNGQAQARDCAVCLPSYEFCPADQVGKPCDTGEISAGGGPLIGACEPYTNNVYYSPLLENSYTFFADCGKAVVSGFAQCHPPRCYGPRDLTDDPCPVADVGKSCLLPPDAGGSAGTCLAARCYVNGLTTDCTACIPSEVASSQNYCAPDQLGIPCGDGGICQPADYGKCVFGPTPASYVAVCAPPAPPQSDAAVGWGGGFFAADAGSVADAGNLGDLDATLAGDASTATDAAVEAPASAGHSGASNSGGRGCAMAQDAGGASLALLPFAAALMGFRRCRSGRRARA